MRSYNNRPIKVKTVDKRTPIINRNNNNIKNTLTRDNRNFLHLITVIYDVSLRRVTIIL